jgi:hypothetical protein
VGEAGWRPQGELACLNLQVNPIRYTVLENVIDPGLESDPVAAVLVANGRTFPPKHCRPLCLPSYINS